MRRASLAAAALALAACGGGGARRDLESADPERRAAAVSRLGLARDDGDLAVLLVAQQDPSPLVRKAAAGAFTTRGGSRAIEGLSRLLLDADPEVVAVAARGLGAISSASPGADARATAGLQQQAAQALAAAYGRADSGGRAEIAMALAAVGASLREAIEAEARQFWERNTRSLAGKSGSERAGAAEEIGRSGRAEAVKLLLPLADSKARDSRLAAAAARGLGWAGDRSGRERLEDALLQGDASLAEAAAAALAALGDPAAAEALAEAGATGPSRVALACVNALLALPRAPEVGVALCEITVRTLDPQVAALAGRGARAAGGDCPERPLATRIGRRGNDALAALAALGALGLPPDRLEAPADRALALLQAPGDGAVRAAAARALGLAGYARAVPVLERRAQALQERIGEARQPWVSGPLASGPAPGFEKGPPAAEEVALRPPPDRGKGDGAIATPRWVDPLDPGDAEEMAAVAVALARLKADKAPALAAGLLADPDGRIRAGAAEAVGLCGDEAARARMASLVADPSPGVRRAAVAALGRQGAKGVPALARALAVADPDPEEWREAVAYALGETGAAEAVPPLSTLLEGAAAPSAGAALGRLGTREAAVPLLSLLERRQAVGRAEAIEALALCATPEAGKALQAELTSDRPSVRVAAARAVGRLHFEPASAWLEALRADYYADVRRAAVEALARLPSRGPGRER
ncbi:MAG TPA: HEAT repeat domain-containing protein [Anaeromyxobacteraceae bacterium]|nr:HEAT repeat domain-containing protein [Anaeromyxobacteraceae bacterium]